MTDPRSFLICLLSSFLLVSVVVSQSIVMRQPKSVLQSATGAIGFSPDGVFLAVRGLDGSTELRDVKTGRLTRIVAKSTKLGTITFFSPGWQNVARWDWGNNSVKIWHVPTGRLKTSVAHQKPVTSVSFDPGNELFATSSSASLEAKIWDVETGELRATFHHPKPYEYANGVGNAVFSSDGKILITSSERTIFLWNIADLKLLMKLIDPDVAFFESTLSFRMLKGFSHGDTIYDIVLSPNGRNIASVSRDHTAKVWNLETGELQTKLQGHKHKVIRAVFSPNGRLLATGSEDRTARLWDIATGKLMATLQHRGTVASLAFSPGGKLLATASDNERKVNFWDATTGRLVAELAGGRGPLAFSPDGRTLATASRDKTVLLWDVPVR